MGPDSDGFRPDLVGRILKDLLGIMGDLRWSSRSCAPDVDGSRQDADGVWLGSDGFRPNLEGWGCGFRSGEAPSNAAPPASLPEHLFGKSPAAYAATVDKVRPFCSRFVTLRHWADEHPSVPRS